ncbi:MAG TPA: GntR family transcriptional regulator [Phototrophicaceae bacterium]|nr:GntR family transcriptional regulator [Phototrophicaceae bacterium]
MSPKFFDLSDRPSPAAKKARLPSIADQVYEQIKADVIRGELPPGHKLVELEVAEQMGTSQGPVREALQRLEYEGLVERVARSATFVTQIVTDELYELSHIRSIVEGFAVSRTAQVITDEQINELQNLILKMTSAASDADIMRLADFDMEFHRRICEWSGNAWLLRVWLPISGQIQRFIVHSHPRRYPDLVHVATRHQPIVDALRSREPETASRVLREHVLLIWLETTANGSSG